jgi:hypothetical protein
MPRIAVHPVHRLDELSGLEGRRQPQSLLGQDDLTAAHAGWIPPQNPDDLLVREAA